MTEDRTRNERYVVTDHDRIRRLTGAEGLEPVTVERADGRQDIRLQPAPIDRGEARTPDDRDVQRISWDEFFDRFEASDRAVQFRRDEADEGSGVAVEVVDRSTLTGTSPDDVATEDPPDVETEPLATGDTGDAEPVAFERTEESASDRDDGGEAAVAPASDAERGPTAVTDDIVLDEIHTSRAGMAGGVSDEYLVFENAGQRPIDVSGWTVENGRGRSYRFPEETVLEPGTRLTLHSEPGDDETGHRYWGADAPVWDDKQIEIIVETGAGERVLRETYET